MSRNRSDPVKSDLTYSVMNNSYVCYLNLYKSNHPIPHHTAPHHTAPHHTAPHHTTPHQTAPHHTTPHHTKRNETKSEILSSLILSGLIYSFVADAYLVSEGDTRESSTPPDMDVSRIFAAHGGQCQSATTLVLLF